MTTSARDVSNPQPEPFRYGDDVVRKFLALRMLHDDDDVDQTRRPR